MNVRRAILALITASILFSLIGLDTPQVAYAGSNGQQLSVWVCNGEYLAPIYYYRVEVTGKNQNGRTVTWNSGNYKVGCKVDARNWWWVGNVSITVYRKIGLGDKPRTWKFNANVPRNQFLNDWVNVSVPR